MSEPIEKMFEQLMDRGMRLLELGTRNSARIDNNEAEILRTRERNHEIAQVLGRLEERQIAMETRLTASIKQVQDDVQFLVGREREGSR